MCALSCRKYLLRLLLAVLIGLTWTTLATAAWRVLPIRIDLDARHKTGSVTVINEGDEPLRFQLKAVRWQQNDAAEDYYEETEELVFFPRILSVPPGEERMVRAGLKLPASEQEKTYRLFIEQLPEQTPDSAAQVSILVRFGVPVFSSPRQPDPQGELDNLKIVGSQFTFDVINQGNVNLQIHSATVQGIAADGTESFIEADRGWYLLAGHRRKHTIQLPAHFCNAAEKLQLNVNTDKLDMNRVVELGPEQCGR